MTTYTPIIIPAGAASSGLKNLELLKKKEGVVIFDEIKSQLKELVKSQNPKTNFKENPEKYQHYIEDYLAGRPENRIGNWVYYPWRNTLVHLLGKNDFVEVRTNRNKYKITESEQILLGKKIVGVIGLSVGQTVAVTMAMERVFGEIRLADFDEIELSNLNRIRTGVCDLGVNKAILAAREILEIDPYLTVKVYDQGVNQDNIDSFFTEGGNLDALIEECDGLDIKIMARNKAKELGIPVVMETNDRAMLDIERFDLEPDRPILHGLVKGLDIEVLKTLKTNEDKVPYMLDMIGIEDTSVLLRASMLEIEQSISTWPQLASSVAFGGGLVADTVKRILLGNNVVSGRYYNDFEGVGEAPKDDDILYSSQAASEDPDFDFIFDQLELPTPNEAVDLSDDVLNTLVSDVLQAPSAANNQPWKWLYKSKHLVLFHDVKRGNSFWDQEHLAAALSLGCGLANLNISALSNELVPQVSLNPENLGSSQQPIASIWFKTSNSNKHDLYDSIHSRKTNRQNLLSAPIEPSELNELQNSVSNSGYDLHIITDHELKSNLGDVLGKVEQIRLLNPNGHRDFVNEVRWTSAEAEEKRNGIDIGTINLSLSEKAGLVISKNEKVIQKLREWDAGDAFGELITKGVNLSAGLCFITCDKYDNEAKLNAGTTFQNLWLTSAKLNLEIHPLTSVAILFNLAKNNASVLADQERTKLHKLNETFNALLGIKESQRVFMAFRLSKTKNSSITSYRFNKNESFAKG